MIHQKDGGQVGQTISHYKSQNHLRTSFVSRSDFALARRSIPVLISYAGGDPDESASADEEGTLI